MMISYDDIKSGRAAVPAEKAPEVRDHDLDLSEIKLDQSAQPREALNNDHIAEYADAMKAGDQFPPLTVFHDGSTYWLADGFHRHYAAQHAGRKHIRCHVRQGGLRDAILWSVGANAKHGLARSDEDKKRAVMRLLEDAEWSTWTDRDIAKRCHVSHPFVAKIRKAHAGDTGNASSMERTYVHPKTGKPTTMKTAGINAGRTQFQAKASEDNGSITGGAGAVTGEASRLASGRTDAGEAASVDLPTSPRNIVAEVRALWGLATPAERDEIRAIINSSMESHESGNAPRCDSPLKPVDEHIPGALVANSGTVSPSAVEAVTAPVAPSPNPAGAVPPSQSPVAVQALQASAPEAETPPSASGGTISQSSDGEGPVEAAGSEQPSADHVSPPVRNRDEGIGSANTGGGYVTPTESEQVTTNAPNEEQTSLAAREGEQAAASNSKPDCLKLKDGHCKLSFSTSALCAECNAERMKRRSA